MTDLGTPSWTGERLSELFDDLQGAYVAYEDACREVGMTLERLYRAGRIDDSSKIMPEVAVASQAHDRWVAAHVAWATEKDRAAMQGLPGLP